MKIACISDLHGHLPDTTGLEFDLLLIGGDLTPFLKTYGNLEVAKTPKFPVPFLPHRVQFHSTTKLSQS